MSDDPRRREEDGEDAALRRDLQRLGPLLRHREETDGEEPDASFVVALEARLRGERAPTPLPMAPRPMPSAGPGRAATPRQTPVQSPGQRQPLTWRFALAAMVAVLAIGALSLIVAPLPVRSPSPSSRIAFGIPTPSRADLLRGFPQLGGGGGVVEPAISLVNTTPGAAYSGYLSVAVPMLGGGPTTVRVYRLAPPSFASARVRTMAASLGIHAAVVRQKVGARVWSVVAAGGLPSSQPLRSLAVDESTGEVIFHDRTYNVPRDAPAALPVATTTTLARAWLSRLGWPGAGMPVQSIVFVSDDAPGTRQVSLGWAGAGPAASAEAMLWAASNGRIVEAHLWPPIDGSRTIAARALAQAIAAVRAGSTPIAVIGVSPLAAASGKATVRSASETVVLTVGHDDRLYLTPAYRFSGTVVLRASPLRGADGVHQWYTLTSAMGS